MKVIVGLLILSLAPIPMAFAGDIDLQKNKVFKEEISSNTVRLDRVVIYFRDDYPVEKIIYFTPDGSKVAFLSASPIAAKLPSATRQLIEDWANQQVAGDADGRFPDKAEIKAK